jgi:hypothetical protein
MGSAEESQANRKIEEDQKFYFDISKFEVQAIAQRNQAMLVFQSMAFAALMISIGKSDVFFPIYILMVVGLVSSFIWIYVNWLTYVVENKAMEELEKIDPRVTILLSSRNKNILLRFGSVSKMMSFGFPILMICSWSLLLFFYSMKM